VGKEGKGKGREGKKRGGREEEGRGGEEGEGGREGGRVYNLIGKINYKSGTNDAAL